MGQIAETIIPNLRTSIMLGGLLAKDIKPETFARVPMQDGKPVNMNHPAFNYGHLGAVPGADAVAAGQGHRGGGGAGGVEALFKAGAECKDDPQGTIYPKMDAIIAAYNRGYNTVLNALASVDDEVMLRQNPIEGRLREMCPTVGAAVAFMAMSHPMMHLGQVSAWRACSGSGPPCKQGIAGYLGYWPHAAADAAACVAARDEADQRTGSPVTGLLKCFSWMGTTASRMCWSTRAGSRWRPRCG